MSKFATVLGIVIMIVGFGAGGLLISGNAPEQLAKLPINELIWILIGLGGGLLAYLNRRPGN
jgi:hypothetical protein